MKTTDLIVDILPKETKPEPTPAADRPSTGLKKPTQEQESVASTGLKKPSKREESKVAGKVTPALTKEVKNNEGAKPDSTDPIEIAVLARKQAKAESISEADAKKIGVAVPKALKLAFKKPDIEVNLMPSVKPTAVEKPAPVKKVEP